MKQEETDYSTRVSRNAAVLNDREQEALSNRRVAIIGCGGIGGVAAHAFARSGVSHFVLNDFDSFDATNINRQISAYGDTVGKLKSEVLTGELKRISEDIEVESSSERLSLVEAEALVRRCDFIFPAADEFAFSLMLFRFARRHGKPALLVVPAGLFATVSLLLPDGPAAEAFFGLPQLKGDDHEVYAQLKKMFAAKPYRKAGAMYLKLGGWSGGYWKGFLAGELPPSQVCPLVWSAASMGVLQSVLHLSGKPAAVSSPSLLIYSSKGVKQYSLRSSLGLKMKLFLRRRRIERNMKLTKE